MNIAGVPITTLAVRLESKHQRAEYGRLCRRHGLPVCDIETHSYPVYGVFMETTLGLFSFPVTEGDFLPQESRIRINKILAFKDFSTRLESEALA